MSVAILGAQGQLGAELVHRLGGEAVPFSRYELDITDAGQIDAALTKAAVNAVINCAAYNAVDLAEVDPEAAYRINALGPRALAAFCERARIPLIHISSDYVFGLDRQRVTPYRETDLPGPQGAYAVSKLAGEEFVRAGCSRYFILRTCGLYGFRGRSGKPNFVETMLKLGREKPELRIVNDQRCTPTATKDVAEAVVGLLATSAYGTYHATNSGDCTWAEFAAEIFGLAKLSPMVIPVTSVDYGAKAPRPAYSVLNCEKLAGVIGKPLPSWQDALSRYLSERESIS
jgi:dTDP-4-dehydrorhamnose reductase